MIIEHVVTRLVIVNSYSTSAIPACATGKSFSMVEPETPIAVITLPLASLMVRPQAKVIKP